MARRRDAIVIGSGPNGLAAAIVMARAGRAVTVFEAEAVPGGGARSAELTLPGFLHDICSAIHPLAAGSPFFRSLPLGAHGLEWVHPAAPLAHPLDGGRAVLVERSVEATAEGLGEDGSRYRRLMAPVVRDWEKLEKEVLSPPHLPRHPVALARFGLRAARSAEGLARSRFRGEPARALLAGIAAHSVLPLDRPPSAAFGIVLGALAHTAGWPMPRGGSRRISQALISVLRELGGEVETAARIDAVGQLPPAETVLCDVSPRELIRIAGERLPEAYRRRLEGYRYGPGAFKMDWALDAPIPWEAEECLRAGTVHLGGTLEEIAASERAPWEGRAPERPFVLLAQQSLFDGTRAPEGRHTVWAYCHVPNGSAADMTERIEAQIERFAPGFRDRILERSVLPPVELERRNANLVGGEVSGGVADFRQIAARPVLSWTPYATPVEGLYLCSASTPPGGGVHGLCGYHAARAALAADGRGGFNGLPGLPGRP